mmetsp:Transcript_65813/g.182367  ORF Transcript_65813/g.182367 Transcript_65813/m.182367 type:complete len:262 (+) Transcript_65813:246-1031(+)
MPPTAAVPPLQVLSPEGHRVRGQGAAGHTYRRLDEEPAANAAAQAAWQAQQQGRRTALLGCLGASSLQGPRAEDHLPRKGLAPSIPTLLAIPEARKVILPGHALGGHLAALRALLAGWRRSQRTAILLGCQARHSTRLIPLIIHAAWTEVKIDISLLAELFNPDVEPKAAQDLVAGGGNRVGTPDVVLDLLPHPLQGRLHLLQQAGLLQGPGVGRQRQERSEALRRCALLQAAQQPFRRQWFQRTREEGTAVRLSVEEQPR